MYQSQSQEPGRRRDPRPADTYFHLLAGVGLQAADATKVLVHPTRGRHCAHKSPGTTQGAHLER